jgi:hypothetical protein
VTRSDGAPWWEPTGAPGRIEVHEPVAPDGVHRRLAAAPTVEVPLGEALIGDRVVEFGALGRTRFARAAGERIALLDLSAPADPTGAFRRPVVVLGDPGEAVLDQDVELGGRLRGPLRFLRVTAGSRTWVWHYAGGRAAGERLVLVPGDRPDADGARVVTHPAAQGRSLGNPTGGASVDTHVTTWTGDAAPAEVLLVELLATTWLGALVDHRMARVAAGAAELLASAPRPDANTT